MVLSACETPIWVNLPDLRRRFESLSCSARTLVLPMSLVIPVPPGIAVCSTLGQVIVCLR